VVQQGQVLIAGKIVEGIKAIHRCMIAHPTMTKELKERGFVFEVIEHGTAEHSVRLIELYHFDALNGCGSCLSHRIRDARVLYGLQRELEFRVAV